MSESVNTSGAYIIVTGNEKGGCGKTTVTMHLAVSLLYDGMKVATIDLDARQRSLSRYIENRIKYAEVEAKELPHLTHYIVNKSDLPNKADAEADECSRFEACLAKAVSENDVVIVDAPGNDTYLSRLAHSYGDTIVTPINDSFIDLDVIAHVKADTLDMSRPGVYSEVVWQAKMQRAKRDRGEIDWVVLRNRLSNLDAHNKRQMADALDKLSKKTGCRIAQGFSERVIYRELFLKGLTLLDVMDAKSQVKVRMTHIAARQELRELVHFLDINYRVRQKMGVEEESAAGGGGAPKQQNEELSHQDETTPESAALETPETPEAIAPLPENPESDVTAETQAASYVEENQASNAKAVSAEVYTETAAQESEEPHMHHYTLEELSQMEEALENESAEQENEAVTDDITENEVLQSDVVAEDAPADAPAEVASDEGGLSEDTKAKLNAMLAKSKEFVESDEGDAIESADVADAVSPDSNLQFDESSDQESPSLSSDASSYTNN